MVLERLKQDTGKLHHELETRLDFLGGEWDRDRFTRLLTAFTSFYQPLEMQLLRLELPLDYHPRRKYPRLWFDLEQLGIAPTSVGFCPSAPLPETTSAGLGTMYVLEGATLGGQHICRHLRSLDPELPLAFFTGYGLETGRMWKEFRETLEDFSSQQTGETDWEIMQAARDTFAGLRDWLETTGVIA